MHLMMFIIWIIKIFPLNYLRLAFLCRSKTLPIVSAVQHVAMGVYKLNKIFMYRTNKEVILNQVRYNILHFVAQLRKKQTN